MTNIIVRAKGIGPETTPAIAELAGLTVVNSSTDEFPSEGGYAFRWGTSNSIPSRFKTLNRIDPYNKVTDKKGFRVTLSEKGLSPLTFSSLEDMLLKSTQWPVQRLLVRPAHHQRSEGMFLCASPCELIKAIREIDGPYYISEFVNKQREFRVFVAQNRIAWMIEKHPKSADEISWGCVQDGKFDYVGWSDWPVNVSATALKSMKEGGLDFGAVDIIVDEEGRALVTEINTAPWLSPYYIKCIAKVFKHVVENGRDHFDDVSEYDWRNVIHPAIGG